MACEQWDATELEWTDVTSTDPPFDQCNTASGIVIEVDSGTDAATYDNYRPEVTLTYRVVYTSTYSMVTDGTDQVIDQFTITYRDACYNLALTLTAGVEDFTYLVHPSASMVSKSPTFTDSSSGACSTLKTWYGKKSGADEDAWQLITASSPVDFPTLGFVPSSGAGL